MAGETDEIELEDAIGIASFQVAMGRVPPASAWVDGLIQDRQQRFHGGILLIAGVLAGDAGKARLSSECVSVASIDDGQAEGRRSGGAVNAGQIVENSS